MQIMRKQRKTIIHRRKWWSKFAPKDYETRYNWLGKVIHWELCKKFKSVNTNKTYQDNPEYVQEN